MKLLHVPTEIGRHMFFTGLFGGYLTRRSPVYVPALAVIGGGGRLDPFGCLPGFPGVAAFIILTDDVRVLRFRCRDARGKLGVECVGVGGQRDLTVKPR